MKRLLLLVVALIVYGSLYPWQFHYTPSAHPLLVVLHGWPERIDRGILKDIVLNVLLYIPLGMLGVLSFPLRRSRTPAAAAAIFFGFLLSVSMETLQVYVPGRDPSIVDVITNTTGTICGAIAALLLRDRIERLNLARWRSLPNGALLLLGCWLTDQLYPFFPSPTHAKLWHVEAVFRSQFHLSPPEIWAQAAEWIAALLAMRAISGRARWWWPAAAIPIVAARVAIATRVITPDEAAAVLVAWLLWIGTPDSWRIRAGIGLMGSALVLRELSPFYFSPDRQPFSWIPFVATLDSQWESAIIILARKAFDYGAMVWLLRKYGIGYLRAGLGVAAALFVFECLQMYLPGRTPEITDPVLAVMMAAALWMSGERR